MKILVPLVLLASAPALADIAPPPPPAPSAESLVSALELPVHAHALVVAGVPEAEVAQVLAAAQADGVPADEAAVVLGAAVEAEHSHGPIDNFGAFVQQKLDEGLRGQDLAAAIRAEHEARGKGHGKPEDAEHGKAEAAGHGKPEGAGKPDEAGKSAEHGKPEGKGKPESTGKPEGKGKKGGAQ